MLGQQVYFILEVKKQKYFNSSQVNNSPKSINMAHKKQRATPRKRKKHAPAKRHKRRVSGLNPSVVSGTKRRKTHRRKKMGAVTGSNIGDAILGVVAGTAISIVYDKIAPIDNEKARHGLQLALGLGATAFGVKKNNMLILGIGLSVAADGSTKLAKDFGVIQGITDMMAGIGLTPNTEDAMIIEMNGIGEQSIMGSLDMEIPVISGAENIMGSDMPSVVSGQ